MTQPNQQERRRRFIEDRFLNRCSRIEIAMALAEAKNPDGTPTYGRITSRTIDGYLAQLRARSRDDAPPQRGERLIAARRRLYRLSRAAHHSNLTAGARIEAQLITLDSLDKPIPPEENKWDETRRNELVERVKRRIRDAHADGMAEAYAKIRAGGTLP